MSEDETLYAAEPNRVFASGAETLDAIALSFVVRTSGVTIEARTGSVSERTISIDYADIFAVERVAEVGYGVCVETTETEYTVTNITSSLDEIERVVAAIRERITGLRSGTSRTSSGSSGPTPSDRGGPTGSPSAADGGASRAPPPTNSGPAPDEETADDDAAALGFGGSPMTARSGDTIECPACGHKTLVPETIPPDGQDVVCPDCGDVVGYTHEDGECVYIDPDGEPAE
jgi:DNA-directed RNA polymerase subunit RPC12/RpoP